MAATEPSDADRTAGATSEPDTGLGQTTASGETAETPDRYPWVAMGVVLIGTFMVILDTTIVNVALPQIGIALDRRDGIEWVVTSYLLAVGVAQPPTGWLADRFGRKKIFIASLAFFMIGSLGCATADSLEMLVAWRVVQGLGGGALMPVGMAMIYELVPADRRGTALGIWGVAAMAGPAFGPVIGGYLVTTVSWHWLFLINVPVGCIAITAAVRLLRETGYRDNRRFDSVGLGLATVGLVLCLPGLAQASEWGWGSTSTLGLLGAGAVVLTLFVRWEQHVPHPAVDVAMFRVPIFSLTLVVIGMATIVQYGILVFLPLTLETVRGWTALHVGVVLVPTAIGGAITFPLGGRLTDRIGPRVPVISGLALLATSAIMLGRLSVDSPTWVIVVALFAQGLGFGFSMMPNSVVGLNALPGRFVAQATAVRQLNVRVSAAFGIAVLGTLLAHRLPAAEVTGPDHPAAAAAQNAYGDIFTIAAGIAVVGLVLATRLPGRARNRELQLERAAEGDAAALEMADTA